MGARKNSSRAPGGLGFRVWKIKVPRSARCRLRDWYYLLLRLMMTGQTPTPKKALRYKKEWLETFSSAVKTRLRNGGWVRKGEKRVPRLPPLHIPVRFTTSRTRAGMSDAPIVIDLRSKQLRIPCMGFRVQLREGLVRALEEENLLEPRPEFVVQLTSKGRLRVVAQRRLEPPPATLPLRVVAVDENARHGFCVAVFDFDEGGYCSLVFFKVLKPVNHGYREGIASALRSYADKPSALADLREHLDLVPAPEDARKLAEKTLAKKKRVNSAFCETATALVRKLIREAQGARVVILVDPIDHDSLQGTPLQGTLLRVRRALRNLAKYEGAAFHCLRASGKRCPLCGREGVEISPRAYRCEHCGLEWDRDRAAVVNLVRRFLTRSLKEECQGDDLWRLLDSLEGWVRRHRKFLAP